MGRSPEAINAQAANVAGLAQRAITDETCTQPRRELDIRKPVRQPKTKAAVGYGVFGVTAIDRVSGELRRIAQVFLAGATVPTQAAGRAEPRYPDAIPGAIAVTPSPTETTMPTISCPGMIGERAWGSSPSTTCRSVRHTPQA